MPGLTDEEEEREQPQPHIAPKIDRIAPLIAKDGKIDKEEEKLQKARSALGNVYQQIEKDFHGNRAAVKQVRKLLAGTTDAAYDYMRTFMRLAHHFGLVPEDDLVDMAQKLSDTSAVAEDEEQGVTASSTAPRKPAKKLDELPARENAIDRHKKALEGGEKPPIPDGPDLVQAADDTVEEIARMRAEDAESFERQGATAH